MHVESHIPDKAQVSILDVGCNVGAWLLRCREVYPDALLAGVEINGHALKQIHNLLPDIIFGQAVAERLPFEDSQFDCVTCLEVLEHLPERNWKAAIEEMKRTLKPGGVLILTVPHAGLFAWLDSNNVRHRLPLLYRTIFGRGLRDLGYDSTGRTVEWHKHFHVSELKSIISETGWSSIDFDFGGLFLMPIADWLSWPFYKAGAPNHWFRRMLGRLATWDYRINFGRYSYGVCVVCTKER